MKSLALFLMLAISGIFPVLGQNFYKNISVAQADTLIRVHEGKGDLVIMDVRTPDEFLKGHIGGAINRNFWGKEFENSILTLNLNRIYLIYCTSGVRSRGAMKKMHRLGFQRLYNMNGGMIGWRAAKLPLVSEK